MVAEGRVSKTSFRTKPKRIGRVSGIEPTSRFGYTAIGNAMENRGKGLLRRNDEYISSRPSI